MTESLKFPLCYIEGPSLAGTKNSGTESKYEMKRNKIRL